MNFVKNHSKITPIWSDLHRKWPVEVSWGGLRSFLYVCGQNACSGATLHEDSIQPLLSWYLWVVLQTHSNSLQFGVIFAELWISRKLEFLVQIPYVAFLTMPMSIRAQIFKPNKSVSSSKQFGIFWSINHSKMEWIVRKMEGRCVKKIENHIFLIFSVVTIPKVDAYKILARLDLGRRFYAPVISSRENQHF